MNKEEKIPNKKDKRVPAIIPLLCVAFFIIGFTLSGGWLKLTDEYCINSSIPTRDSINTFCENEGFEFGTLDTSSCEGGIYCHREVGIYDEWKCFPGNG